MAGLLLGPARVFCCDEYCPRSAPEARQGRVRRLLDDAEGCLSVPGATLHVPRPDRAVVRGFDRDGEPLVIEGTGYFARCLAHEADHCDGRLYLDRLSARERKAALRQAADRRDEVLARRAADIAALNA